MLTFLALLRNCWGGCGGDVNVPCIQFFSDMYTFLTCGISLFALLRWTRVYWFFANPSSYSCAWQMNLRLQALHAGFVFIRGL